MTKTNDSQSRVESITQADLPRLESLAQKS